MRKRDAVEEFRERVIVRLECLKVRGKLRGQTTTTALTEAIKAIEALPLRTHPSSQERSGT